MSASAYTSAFWARQNPIFVRCLRSRLRPNQVLAYGAITVVIAGFIFAMVFLAGGRVAGTATVARTAIVPLLALQSFILLLLGTGSAATGVALERDLGMLDFHRMTPMSPTSKILGFLFGLPVREYFMFALTLPFMLAAFVLAEVSLFRVLELYVVFGSGVLLYHLTGMAAGMVTKRARRASWLAQAIVLILYFVLPQFGHAGFTSFSYLTYMPTLRSLLAEELKSLPIESVHCRLYHADQFLRNQFVQRHSHEQNQPHEPGRLRGPVEGRCLRVRSPARRRR